ncbi:glycerol-3-phosphate dehydrogenase [Rhodobium orientis]|uniref:Glycerol-3-phosphate dehydrogenase n=1 Tax=Rhodobium orientis TaxID=34017 RepID=A0A327JW87_9HYPH|nr:FAD-dependent oxidoreductase [Rhodobium orientis]MBB4302778.1 glycerol-3-phosphate dehydrogenase [Rhodobium orientis]MBK5948558.1 glycerol-3-phosphate dehydrogenase [Rhodobium orientis]RAI29824.1 glycerol-3-phosphate dehydrogenase [Rhodobium orientis]
MKRAANRAEEQETYDVVVIGGGVNGTAALRELTRAGYRTLLAEVDDFASGASGRSSRMLHCGLRYFETEHPVWDIIRHPLRFARAADMARQAMLARTELAGDETVATRAIELSFPVWDDGPYPRWQLDLGIRLLGLLGPSDPPLDRRVRNAEEARHHPIGKHLRDQDTLRGMVSVREYLFGAPERLCVDNAVDAEAHGADICLQTRAEIRERDAVSLWRVALEDVETGDFREVRARTVLNMAGTWADDVGTFGKRLVRGTKGAHIILRLPAGYANRGIATLHRRGYPFYGLPLGDDRYYFGPTETLFDGDAHDIRVEAEDLEFLIGETNHLLPGLNLTRADIEQCWAGVRPLTHDPDRPMGARERTVHDLADKGFDNVLAMTAGPVMSHRSAGREMLARVRSKIGSPQRAAVRTPQGPGDNQADAEVRAVTKEHAHDLHGVLVQRTGAVWEGLLGPERVGRTAEKLAPLFGWDAGRTQREVTAFLARQEREFGPPDGADTTLRTAGSDR